MAIYKGVGCSGIYDFPIFLDFDFKFVYLDWCAKQIYCSVSYKLYGTSARILN